MERNHNRKKCFSDPIYASKFVIFFCLFLLSWSAIFSIRIFPSASAIRHPQVSGSRSTNTLCSVLLFFHVVSGMQLNIA